MKSSISRYDYLWGLFSLVTSLLVYGASLLVTSIMVYHNFSLKWTFVCYVVSSGWLLVMNITSNVVMITAKKTVRRENPRTCRQTSVNLELLNNPNGTRYLSYPPAERFERADRGGSSECAISHTPPPSYEDVSQVVCGESNNESFSSGTATPQGSGNDKALYEVLESANEIKKVRETLRGEYGSEKKTQKCSPEDGWNSSRKGSDSNQQVVVVERVVQNLGDEKARRILHQRIEERRNQLDRRLEGDSLRKMNEYCMRDLKNDHEKRSPRQPSDLDKRSPRQPSDLDKRSPCQPSELTPKESLRRNLKAKYGSLAENVWDIHSSRDSVTSQPRNIERCELPRVHHAKSTQSLKSPSSDSISQRSVRSSHSSEINSSGLSLQEVHMRGSQPDIRAANEVGLPLERTWKQKPVKLPASTHVNLDSSFSLKHLDDRKRRDVYPCSRSKSMPGRQTSREKDDGRF